VSSLSKFFEADFNTQREQWEKTLLAELRIPELGSKGTKKLLSGGNFPTLSLEARTELALHPVESWKKASNTYAAFEGIEESLEEDLRSGVKNFFIYRDHLTEDVWRKVSKLLRSQDGVEVFLLG
jgi:hypothetical protein